MHTAFFYKMANDFAFDYVFWMFFGIFWCSSIWSSILDLEPVHYGVFLGISVVGQGPGFPTSAAQQSAIGLPRRGIQRPKLAQCNFDGLFCICCICCSQILPDLSKLYGFMHGFYPPDGTETVSTPLQSS